VVKWKVLLPMILGSGSDNIMFDS